MSRHSPFEVDLRAVVAALAVSTPLPMVWAEDVPKLWRRAKALLDDPACARMLTEDGPDELLAEGFSEGDADAIVALFVAMRDEGAD